MDENVLNSIFHAYDIRGKTPDELNGEFYYNLGKAFVTFTRAKNIVVGYDIRPESLTFSENFTKGAVELGCNIINIGEIATEMLYFAVGSDKSLDGGAVITASHNPAGWNGCKLVGKDVKPFSSNYGLSEIKEIIKTSSYGEVAKEAGKATAKNIYPDFKNKVLSFMLNTEIKPLNIVVDAGNGVGGKVFDYIFGDLGLNIHRMYFEPDGTFPHHVPDPLKEENVEEIKKRVVELYADLGVAIDGDADRVFFLDSKGRNPNGIFTGSILAKYFCKVEEGAKIIHDPRVIWPITKEISKYKGQSIINKAGHSFFKERMKIEDAIFGAELSSHFFYRDYFYSDSGMITIALMLKMISQGLNFEEELNYLYSNYFTSGEVNYTVENKDEIINKIKEHYSSGKLNDIDGISIEFDEWRFNLRKSNTEPYLRLNLESLSEKALQEKFEEIDLLINQLK